MSASLPGAREIAAGFAAALLPALEPGAGAAAHAAARDVAQIMGLAGLEAALAALREHEGPVRPAEAEHLASSIRRVVTEAADRGDLERLRRADAELGALATQVDEARWSAPAGGAAPPVAVVTLGELLADLRLDAGPEVREAGLAMPVASALRAAIDWIGADDSPRLTATVHDSALALTAHAPHAGGLGPAGAVLASVEGSIVRERDGRWTLRVPRACETPSFLLLRQGRYGFALPWHMVVRLRMFAPGEIETLAEPRLAPLATSSPPAHERPAALVALGLVRAWFVADRVVWRLAAQPEEPGTPGPFSAARLTVEADDGERYWVLDPAWLLRGVEAPGVAPPASRPRATEAATAEAGDAIAPAASRTVVIAPAASLAEAAERALATLRGEREAAERDVAERAAPEAASEAGHAAAIVDEVLGFGEAVDSAPPAADENDEWLVRVEDEVVAAPPVMVEARTDVLSSAAPAAAADEPVAAPASAGAPAPLDVEPPFASPASAPLDLEPPFASPAPLDLEPPFASPASAPRPSELAERESLRRALVVDDSLVARIFLGRLLEKRGWAVETVADAASLWRELARGPWSLVCADFALPDAQGEGWLRRLFEHLGRLPSPVPCIVLTRDDGEDHVARAAGARRVLRKPFDPESLDPLLP